MGKNWMEGFLSSREAKRKDEERKHQLERMAIDATADMLRRLKAQIAADVQAYGDNSITCKSLAGGGSSNGFEVSREKLPSFCLGLDHGRSGVVFWETIKKSSSNPEAARNGSLAVIAKGQGEFYYRIEGKDYACESEASEHFLLPLLSLLDQ